MLRLPVDPSIWRISHFPAKVPFSARRLLSSAAFAQKITEQKKFLLTLQFLSCMLHGNKALSSKDCLLSTDCWRTDIDPNQAIMIPYYISQSYPISNFFLLQRRNFYSCCSRSLLLCNCWLDTSWYAGKTTKNWTRSWSLCTTPQKIMKMKNWLVLLQLEMLLFLACHKVIHSFVLDWPLRKTWKTRLFALLTNTNFRVAAFRPKMCVRSLGLNADNSIGTTLRKCDEIFSSVCFGESIQYDNFSVIGKKHYFVK